MKFLLTLVLSLFAFRVVSAVPATQILVVHSYSQHYPWTNRQDDGFMEVLAGDARLKASVTTEYLDTKRRAYDGTYAKEMARFFGMKYAGYQPAAIYVTDDDALLFALDHLSGIFPGTPVFFSGVNDYGALKTLDPSLATGVFELKEVVPNIDWLRAFDKNANDLIFLGDGTSTYVAIEKEARKALASTGIRATFIAEKNLGFAMDRLRDLPGKYVILATVGGMTDENGNVLPLPEIVKGIVRTGRTIISMEDSYVMEGALGGWVTSGQEQGKAAARLLLAYLHGKPVAELPPILKSPNAMLFDDAALQKRGIQLPGNLRDQAILLNPRPDFYEKHHFLIVGSLFGLVGALFLAVTGGVVVLSRRNRQLHLARQRAEIAVIDQHEALERIQKIASRVPGVVYVYRLRPDGTSCFPFASDAIRDIYRVTPQEVSEDASKVFANLHPDDCDGVVESIQKSARDLTPWQHEYRLKFDDGTVLQLYGNAVPHREADGSVLWHGFIIDITERKQKDSELRQLVERLALATKAGQVGIWDLDVVNNALVWDDNMYSQYGITSDQFAGAYEAWTAGVHPDDRDRGDAEIQMALRGEKDFNTDFRVLWPDGSIHHIRAMALVQRNAAGEPLHMVGTNWDITKLKRAESTLLQNLARAEELTRLKSRFVSMASHELRTP
ncbi:MAG: PAS domain-containing protein, partial [Verrucomicrobiota bacterium]